MLMKQNVNNDVTKDSPVANRISKHIWELKDNTVKYSTKQCSIEKAVQFVLSFYNQTRVFYS